MWLQSLKTDYLLMAHDDDCNTSNIYIVLSVNVYSHGVGLPLSSRKWQKGKRIFLGNVFWKKSIWIKILKTKQKQYMSMHIFNEINVNGSTTNFGPMQIRGTPKSFK